jgi:hypothetical protein
MRNEHDHRFRVSQDGRTILVPHRRLVLVVADCLKQMHLAFGGNNTGKPDLQGFANCLFYERLGSNNGRDISDWNMQKGLGPKYAVQHHQVFT